MSATSCRTRIKNAWLYTGAAGAKLRRSDLLIGSDGRIAAIEREITGCSAAGETVDLHGAVLSHGFVDVHGHSDLALAANPGALSKIAQGVTTEIAGNCGLSAFPLTGANTGHLRELYANYPVELDWHDYSGFEQMLAKRRCAIRLPALCGHNTLRGAVCSYEEHKATAAELRTMEELLGSALEQGALGLSSGLLYVPGKFATAGELVALMRVVARFDRIYTTHLRSEGVRLVESVAETLECARAAGLKRVHLSHLKTAGKNNWHKLDAVLELIGRARSEGMLVTCDRYPYLESATQLSVILPGPWDDMDDSAVQQLLQNSEERRRVLAALERERSSDYWRTVRLASTGAPAWQHGCGKLLSELSPRPAELVLELLAVDAHGTTAAFQGMCMENLRRILALDYCMAGSDGNALPLDDSIGRGHPRAFGAVTKFLLMRLEAGASLEDALWRVTGLPRTTFQLPDAGGLCPGAAADLVAFEPDELEAPADFVHPHTPARGVRKVWVGGTLNFEA